MNNKLSINIEYKLPKSEKDKPSNQKLTQDYINYCVANVYDKGIAGQLRRTDGRLKTKIQDAIDNKNDIIELENDEIKHLKKVVSEASVPTGLTQYFNQLEVEVDKLTV